MRLNDKLVTSFIFDEKKYDIDLAFDNVLDVFDILSDKSLRDYERANICLSFLLDDQEYDRPIELWNYIYINLIGTKEKTIVPLDRKGNPMPKSNDEEDDKGPSYDLEHDAEYIYSSFRQAYGINLFSEQGKLHWQEFKALLNSLPEDTIFQNILEIRLWKPSKHDSAETKRNMKKAQKRHAIPVNKGVN